MLFMSHLYSENHEEDKKQSKKMPLNSFVDLALLPVDI